MPDLPLVPTGGVNADNLGEWLDAGAVCVGVGGDLCSFELIASQQWDEIQRRTRLFIAAVARARP